MDPVEAVTSLFTMKNMKGMKKYQKIEKDLHIFFTLKGTKDNEV